MRRASILGLMLTLGLAAPPLVADLSESRVHERSFELAAGGRLTVDTVFGAIRLVGGDGDRVRLRVEERIEADGAEALERARREVELLIEALETSVDIYVDGPFRHRDERSWKRRHHHPGYRVIYDFVIEAPRDVDVELRTVTEGEIEVVDIHGDFWISNVNGGVSASGLRGAGRLETVNGPILASFGRRPRAASEFRTVNGDVDVTFPPDLSADLELTTRWGEIWSEFEVVSLPVAPVKRRTEGGTTLIEIGGPRVRIARGGPRLSFETLNGDVLIRRHDSRRNPS